MAKIVVTEQIDPSGIRLLKEAGHEVIELGLGGGIEITPEQVGDAGTFIFCYLLIAALFTVINVAGGLDFVTGLTASVACLGNVGPGFGEVGSMANYAHIPAALKGAGIVEMLLGRLEIFPVLYLFGERYVKN